MESKEIKLENLESEATTPRRKAVKMIVDQLIDFDPATKVKIKERSTANGLFWVIYLYDKDLRRYSILEKVQVG